MAGAAENRSCPWARKPLAVAYHDEEWGVPVHDDRVLFEFLVLEGAQAGLSWDTILAKRARYREVFDGFDPQKVARYGARRQAALLADAGIVCNRLKVASAVRNAQAFLALQEECGSFDTWIWQFVEGSPLQPGWTRMEEVPARTEVSDAMSRALKKKGFNFVGSTICYAFMQATGMTNDHLVGCPRHAALSDRPRRRRGG